MTTTNVQPNPNAYHWLSLFEGNTATRLQEDKPLAPKATITLAPQGPGVTGAVVFIPKARRKHATTGRRAHKCDNRPPGAQVRQPASWGRGQAQICDNRPPGADMRQPAAGRTSATTG